MLLDLRYGPMPELQRHHEHHITSESVYSLGSPEPQDMQHLEPSIRNRVEMLGVVTIVDAVIQFYGVVPIVLPGECVEAIIAGSLRGEFDIRIFAISEIDMWSELLAGYVIEVVSGGEEHLMIVSMSEIFYPGRFGPIAQNRLHQQFLLPQNQGESAGRRGVLQRYCP